MLGVPITLLASKVDKENEDFMGNFISNEEISELMLEAQDMVEDIEEDDN